LYKFPRFPLHELERTPLLQQVATLEIVAGRHLLSGRSIIFIGIAVNETGTLKIACLKTGADIAPNI